MHRKALSPASVASTLVVLAFLFAGLLASAGFAQAQTAQAPSASSAGAGPAIFAYQRTDVETGRDAAEACLNFTHGLDPAQAQRYRDFIRIEPAAQPALRVDGNRLCIAGLAFGRSYQVTLREGFPGADNRRLTEAETVNVELRDRQPLVAFGEGLILARESEQGVPINTINVDRLRVNVYRVTDRGIGSLSRYERFQRSLDQWAIRNLVRENVVQVWQGEMAVQAVRNANVTTLFPIRQAVTERRPGIYLIVARNAASERTRPRSSGDDEEDESSDPTLAGQWVIETDIGITTFDAADGLNVFARSLNTARPIEGMQVTLIARNHEELGRATTDASGRVSFPAGLMRGTGAAAPSLVMAFGAEDFVVQDLSRPAFDLSDRGVEGRDAPGPVDAFLYTERGIYRPRETVQIVALLRDRIANAITGTPVTISVRRPDGVEYRRQVLNDAGGGAMHWPLVLSDTAPRGRWSAVAMVDGNTPVGRVEFLVQDFVPQRIRVQLATQQTALRPNDEIAVDVQADFLYGAPASDLVTEAEARISVDPTPYPQFREYSFGLNRETFRDQVIALQAANTDASGKTRVTGTLREIAQTTRPLRAEIAVAVLEPGGRATRDSVTLPLRLRPLMIGIRPNFRGGRIAEDSEARFDVIAVDDNGAQVARPGLSWQIVRELSSYQWFQVNGRWRFQRQVRERVIAEGTVSATATDPVQVARTLPWGYYRITVGDRSSGSATSMAFWAGWGGEMDEDRPDRVEVVADKPAYRPGETARIAIRPPVAGEALVVIANDRVLAHRVVSVPADGATVEIPVGSDWGAGAYAVVTSYRPIGSGNRRAPVRAIGVSWLGIDASQRTLEVAIAAPPQILPRQRIEVPVRVTNAEPGARPYLTLAAVDEGILLLTRYQTPQPATWYFGKRRLAADIRDDYGRLIDGSNGVVGTIRQGGDALGGRGLDVVPTRTVALFSGFVQVDADGNARIPLEVPDFIGQLRLMAVAFDARRVGSAEARMIVRDPLVADGIFPRFLAPGDRSQMTLLLHNVEGQPGPYSVRVSSVGAVRIAGGTFARDVPLQVNERQVVAVPMDGASVGIATITLAVSGPGNFTVQRQWQIQVRPPAIPITEEQIAVLKPGETLTVGQGLLDNFVAGTGQVAVTLSNVRGFDVPGLLRALDRYPFGCVEQTTSRAYPLLVYDDLRLLGRTAEDVSLRDRVQGAVYRILDMQTDSGDFGMWNPYSSTDHWLSVYAADFLTRAKARGYDVPDQALRMAHGYMRRLVGRNQPAINAARAYALWVLARAGAGDASDTRAFFDTERERIADPFSMAQLGGALLQFGDRARAREAFNRAVRLVGNPDPKDYYSSALRELAGFIAIAAETDQSALIPGLLQRLEAFDRGAERTTTQERAWMLLAANALTRGQTRINVAVDGAAAQERNDPMIVTLNEAELQRGTTLRNAGDREIVRTVSIQGIPRAPLPAIARGISLKRSYFTMAGQPADLSRLRQNDRIIVLLQGRVGGGQSGQIAVLDLLPAGFEIEATLTPNEEGNTPYAFLPRLRRPAVQEARDDRYVAAFNVTRTNPDGTPAGDDDSDQASTFGRNFVFAYVVRAVTPGTYVLPAANAEDMYRPPVRARTAPGAVTIAPR
ncbi:MAG: alpha-2-macroglobulin family protein [Alphaproteobacteria bacterium]|nr:alpha-2-macroglobulin family protein [Alphaproteobacteria bacterium]